MVAFLLHKLHEKENVMEEEQLQLSIRRLLIKIGIRIDLDGFDYLVSAVEFAIKDAELAKNLCDGLYGRVAEKYNTKAYCVERSIRSAIEKAYVHRGLREVNKIFDTQIIDENKRPSSGKFIRILATAYNLKLIDVGA